MPGRPTFEARSLFRRVGVGLLLAMLGLASCEGLRSHLGEAPPFFDGGVDASLDEDPDGSTDGDSGIDAGADAGRDAGPAEDAGLPPLRWTRLPAPSALAFYNVGGYRDDGGLTLIVAADSKLLRMSAGTWSVAYQNGTGIPLSALYVSAAGSVATGGGDVVASCQSDCGDAGAYSESALVGVKGVCGVPGVVYAVGVSAALKGTLSKRVAPSGWSQTVADLGTSAPAACWVAPDGAVLIAARSKVVRVSNNVPASEYLRFPAGWSPAQINAEYFYGLWGSGATVFAAGVGKKIISRSPSGTWDFVYGSDAGSGGVLLGLAGVDAREVHALGSGVIRLTSDWAEWEPVSFDGGFLRAGWAAGPDEVYVVGDDGTHGSLFRGVR